MRVILGVERLSKYDSLIRGKRIGLITNFSGILPDWSQDTAHLLVEAGYELVKIFTPEHGLYGAEAGESVEDMKHPKLGVPVVSLYGSRRTPAPEDLKDLDLLMYDIQDVGLRYYTYIYTMCYSLQAAASMGLPYVILDRPNPLGGRIISGARIDPEVHSFVGDYELPMRYGLTIGETARYFLKYAGIQADLTVIELENYSRDMLFPEQGLLWNTPSPALPTFNSTVCYSGGCLFEALNISEGRGSDKPFQIYGAPFIDMDDLYKDVRERVDDGKIAFRRRSFVPSTSKYQGELCFGLEFHPLKPDCDFLMTALILMKAIWTRYPDSVELQKIPGSIEGHHLSILSGNIWAEEYLSGRMSEKQLREGWASQCAAFEDYAADIRLYR